MTDKIINPLLHKVRMPGTTFRLPSGGIFYKSGELSPDVQNGEVIVYPMRAIDEISMKTPDMLLNGTAITEVFNHCIPQVLKPNELLAKDVDYLLICLRKVTFGSNLEIDVTHTCSSAKKHTYVLDLAPIITAAVPIDPTIVNQTFKMTIDTGQVVNLQPPKYSDVIAMFLADQKLDTPEDLANSTIKTIAGMINNVDDVDNQEFIIDWLKELRAGTLHDITSAIEKTSSWGISTATTVKCMDCGEDVKVEVNLNPVSFFTPR